jgi:DNA-binding NtrC family response regulator
MTMSTMTVEKFQQDEKNTNQKKPTFGTLPAIGRERITVMLLGGDQPALRSLYAALRARTKITLAEDLPAALEKLAHQEISVVFCAACFHCGSWVEALQTIGFLHPSIPVVVVNENSQTQTLADRQSEMYSAGAFDVLHDPQDELSVTVVLAHALASGEARQWQAAS